MSAEVKTVYVGTRTTPRKRAAVQAMAQQEQKTVSQLIHERIVEEAVRRLQAPTAEVVVDAQE